jgi:hypothetical protein
MVLAPLVAVLAVIAVGLVAIIIIYGYKQLIQAVFESLKAIPVVGGWIGSNLQKLVDAANHTAGGWAALATKPIVDLLYRWTTRVEGHTRASGAAHQASLDAHVWTNTVLVPGLVAREQQRADVQDQALEARDVARARQVQTHADAVGQTVHDYADTVAAAVRAYALALAVGNRQLELADLASLRAATAQLVAATADQALADTREQARVVTALMTALVRTAEQEARDLVAGLSDVVAQVSLDDRLYAQQQAGLVGAAATAAIALVATAVDTINRSPCMQRCSTLGNLGAALEALDLGLILLLMAEVARDPRGTARTVQALAQGPLDLARTVFAGATGSRP